MDTNSFLSMILDTLSEAGMMLVWWIIAAIIVLIVSLCFGLFSHVLARVIKKLNRLDKAVSKAERAVQKNEKPAYVALAIKAIAIKAELAERALNIYLYDSDDMLDIKVEDGSKKIGEITKAIEEAYKAAEKGDFERTSALLDKIKRYSGDAKASFRKVIEAESRR